MSYNPIALKKLMTEDKIYVLLESLGANGLMRDSNGFRCSCPIHKGSNNTSFVLNPNKLAYNCYGSCNDKEKAGDIINLVEHSQKCSYTSAIEYICEVCEIDINLLQDNGEFLLEELKLKIDHILTEISNDESIEDNTEFYYGVKPLTEDVIQKFLNLKDELGFIDSQGFKDTTLKLFSSCYDNKEKRWLLPIYSPNKILLGFDGRDITNKKKDKWRKRAGLLKNKLLGRLDIVGEEIQKENKIILVEGKKDMMAVFETDLKHTTCIYGSSLSNEQKELIDGLIDDEIICCFDGDKAGYKSTLSVIKLAYPEYIITALEIEDGEDPATLSKKHLLSLYENRIPIEEWIKRYEYRTKMK
jgi:DNA primase